MSRRSSRSRSGSSRSRSWSSGRSGSSSSATMSGDSDIIGIEPDEINHDGRGDCDDDDGVIGNDGAGIVYHDDDNDDDNDDDTLNLIEVDAVNAVNAVNAITTMDKWLDEQLQASIFYEEPVRHITFHTMFVSDDGVLERVEYRILELAQPNVVDRFAVGRIVKRARLTAGGVVGFRLFSMFVHNVHVSLPQLANYVRNPDAFSFFEALTSLNDIIIKPTLACFHSLNSVHIVLRRLQLPQPLRTDAAATPNTRVVRITPGALSSSTSSTSSTSTLTRRYTRRRGV